MKNLLAEAARVASLADTTNKLLDSGSFDTTSRDFDETANDAAALDGTAADDAIPAEPDVLELEDVQTQWDVVDDDDLATTRATAQASPATVAGRVRPVRHKMPGFVRFSPYLCALLALLGTAAWTFYLDLAAAGNATTLGSAILQAPRDSAVVVDASLSDPDRFEFIDITEQNVAAGEDQ